MSTIAQAETILRAADHAAAQDFRWWFVALLIIGIIVALILFRWFDAQLTRLAQRLDSVQDAHTEFLSGELVTTREALAKNTTALEDATTLIHTLKTARG